LLSRRSAEHVREGIAELQKVVERVGLLLGGCTWIGGAKEIDNVAGRCWRRREEGIVGGGW
jgi:hypothetical protein